MLLEIRVFGSAEWYEDVAPNLETLGFKNIVELNWADPETDGEYMGFYYTYEGKVPMAFNEFAETIREMEKTIKDGEAPFIQVSIVPDKRKRGKS